MLNNIACMNVGDHRGNYQLVDDITEKVKTYSVIGDNVHSGIWEVKSSE